MPETTIGLSSETRDRLREKKGFERTYDEFITELLESHEETDHTERNASPEPRSQ